MSFKVATENSLSKFNLVDGFVDDYNDATGVDASGSVVATIVNQTMSAGSHRIQIEAARYSSGAYMLQTVVGGARQIQTMMIVK